MLYVFLGGANIQSGDRQSQVNQLLFIVIPILVKSIQKSGYDFETTSDSLIIMFAKTDNGANAIAILWSS
jgi:hypothetical protein